MIEEKFFQDILSLLKEKDKEYGNIHSQKATFKTLKNIEPKILCLLAIKHIISYMNSKRPKELIKAGAYLLLEYKYYEEGEQ